MKLIRYMNGFSILGYMGTALSMYLSICMTTRQTGEGSSGLDFVSMCVLGGIITAMQICFIIVGYIKYRNGEKQIAFLAFTLWLLAFCVSMAASIGHFSVKNADESEYSMNHSPAYLRLLEDRERINAQLLNPDDSSQFIQEYDTNINAQREAGKRLRRSQKINRALNNQGIIKSSANKEAFMEKAFEAKQEKEKYLRSQLERIDSKIDNFKELNPSNTDSFYKVIAMALGVSIADAKALCFFILAFLLDAGSALLVIVGIKHSFATGAFDSSSYSNSGNDNAMQARINQLESLLSQQQPEIRQQPENIPGIDPVYQQQPQPIYQKQQPYMEQTPGQDPQLPQNRLKNIPESHRPGYDPRFHMPETGDNSDEMQALAILQANPGLMKYLERADNRNPEQADNHMADNRNPERADNRMADMAIHPKNLQRYVGFLYPEPAKHDGSLNGKNKVVVKSDITNWEGDRIHEFLKENGFVKVIGTKTFPVYDKEQLLDMLGLTAKNIKQKVGF